MKPILVLCLGNEILSDDSFGPKIAEILNKHYDFGEKIEVIFAPLAGFNLLDLLKDRQSVLIVDTIVTGRAKPGTTHFFSMGQLTPSNNLTCSHQISLPTAIKLGAELGISMPEDIDVLAIEAHDIETLSENLTAPVRGAIDTAITQITDWVKSKSEENERYEYGEKKSRLA